MEPASFALAIAGIPGIFKAGIDCFEYVQFARHFGDDFGTCLAQHEATKMQYSRWGTAMGLLDESFDPNSLYERGGSKWPENEIKKMIRWMKLINSKFEAAQKLSEDYVLEQEDEDPDALLVPDQDEQLDKAKPPVRKLVSKMRKITKARRKIAGLGKKVAWALYTKSHFERLNTDTTQLVDKITGLFPDLDVEQKKLAEEELESIEADSVPVLAGILATLGSDKFLASAIAKRSDRDGLFFKDVEIHLDQTGFMRLGNTYQNVGTTTSGSMTVEKLLVRGSGTSHGGHIFTGDITGSDKERSA